MEGEFNFLRFLPKAQREAMRDPGTAATACARASRSTAARRRVWTPRPASAIARRCQDRTAGPLAPAHGAPGTGAIRRPARRDDAALRTQLQRLAAVRGASLQWIPESSAPGGGSAGPTTRWFSLLRDTGHSGVPSAAREGGIATRGRRADGRARRAGQLSQCLLSRTGRRTAGLHRGDAPASLGGRLRPPSARFAVRRTDPGFWAFSDALTPATRGPTAGSRHPGLQPAGNR